MRDLAIRSFPCSRSGYISTPGLRRVRDSPMALEYRGQGEVSLTECPFCEQGIDKNESWAKHWLGSAESDPCPENEVANGG